MFSGSDESDKKNVSVDFGLNFFQSCTNTSHNRKHSRNLDRPHDFAFKKNSNKKSNSSEEKRTLKKFN